MPRRVEISEKEVRIPGEDCDDIFNLKRKNISEFPHYIFTS